jgi:hypothetical protein
MAHAFPQPDKPVDERARNLEGWNCAHDFGRWGYARSVERWWVEGRRACVVVRGVEHAMAADDDPATNQETVWTIALRNRRGEWCIDTYSQGWPAFGSAEKLDEKHKTWLKRWKSGRVL